MAGRVAFFVEVSTAATHSEVLRGSAVIDNALLADYLRGKPTAVPAKIMLPILHKTISSIRQIVQTQPACSFFSIQDIDQDGKLTTDLAFDLSNREQATLLSVMNAIILPDEPGSKELALRFTSLYPQPLLR
jgi:hypothetical protein